MIPKVKVYARQLWQDGKKIGLPCYVRAPTRYLAKLNHAHRCTFDHTMVEYVGDKVTYTVVRRELHPSVRIA